jgi:hypothetical protein
VSKRTGSQLYAARKAAGKCICGQKVRPGRTNCQSCSERQRTRHRKAYVPKAREPRRQAERRAVTSTAKHPQTRACLRCDKPFRSDGPDNRLCDGCREYIHVNPTPSDIRVLRIKGHEHG